MCIRDSLQIKDIPLLEGVEFVDDQDSNIVTCVGSASGRAGATDEEESLSDESSEDSDESKGEEESEDKPEDAAEWPSHLFGETNTSWPRKPRKKI